MYFIAVIVGLVYVVLLVLSGREKAEDIAGVQKPFYKIAGFLYQMSIGRKIPGENQVKKDIVSLNPGGVSDKLLRDYYVKKTALILEIILTGTIASVLVSANTRRSSAVPEEGILLRGFPDEEKSFSLTLTGKDHYGLNLKPYILDRTEAELYFMDFKEKIREIMPGENEALNRVSRDLVLETQLDGFPFVAEWSSDSPDIVNTLGEVIEVEEPVSAVLTMTVFYEDWEWSEDFEVTIVPPDLTEEEKREKEIQKLLDHWEENTRMEQNFSLPRMYNEEILSWKQNVQDPSRQIWFGSICLAVALFFMSDKDLHSDLERRRELIKRDYPDIVQKFVLYMGAGMTARNTLKKLALDYEENVKKGGKARPAYEEMLYSCRELLSGVPESEMYERFGRRTGIQEYVRLCTLLQQNVRKGNSAILERLREEAKRSMDDKIQNCRKLGEEAGTKLLLPMVMMLLVAMVIIMVPVFMSSMI